MSLEINHRRSASSGTVGWERFGTPDQATSAELLWYFFPGDVEILSHGTSLASEVGSVPALHFVAAMVGARDELASGTGSRYSYDFTEADQSISFQRRGGDVRIETSFSTNVLTIPLDEFSSGVRLFARREIEDLGREYPALLAHPLMLDLKRRCGGDERVERPL
ncbi:hypothetical protein I6A84_32020 [Frankia sp. CNm7]|uniref:Uncharacterized protein n=1 Tax=Frankia nepalensis TaxID=1836974 RepID=A0A937UR84_9ACTN|nr:hypothetical protein [Frankia nepalensis]MBL7500657.1 hypothetical protein [Frankia nepalensis]MBL7514180.1 hypothetical protein [Frankia nepalensis]MBL7522590.1 hypothetical protein [Frankia nepalensis]MBL7632609.1 hypothetical protein [Frankia nepalensis]